MKIAFLAGAAVIALGASAASAATHHRHATAESAGRYAPPSQPVAYRKLDAYLKASPSQRARGDWGAESAMAAGAQTGTAANTSANSGMSQPPAGMTAPQGDAASPSQPAASPPDAQSAPTSPAAPPSTPQ
jgi:hypothetical protein